MEERRARVERLVDRRVWKTGFGLPEVIVSTRSTPDVLPYIVCQLEKLSSLSADVSESVYVWSVSFSLRSPAHNRDQQCLVSHALDDLPYYVTTLLDVLRLFLQGGVLSDI
jgi:hypothetical protein